MAEQDLQGAEDRSESVGKQLRLARATAGLSRANVAARTKIAERHLAAIEADRFGDLASSTYAVGFSRAYARAVGLDELEIARAVRLQMGAVDDAFERTPVQTFEPGDPARVPGSRTTWLAALGAVAVIAAIFTFWGSYYRPAVSLPDLAPRPGPTASVPPVAAVVPAVSAPASTAAATDGTRLTPPSGTAERTVRARTAPAAALPSPAASAPVAEVPKVTAPTPAAPVPPPSAAPAASQASTVSE